MWALIPVKNFESAKSRLAGAYAPQARAQLARTLAGVAVRAAVAARGVARVFVLSADEAALLLAQQLGAETLHEPPAAQGFNALIAGALDELQRRGATRLAYLASDLPQLTAAALEQLIDAHAGGLSIGRAQRDGGTNALLFDTPRRFELAFGHDSARRHFENATAARLPAQFVDIPGISLDLDTPDDLLPGENNHA